LLTLVLLLTWVVVVLVLVFVLLLAGVAWMYDIAALSKKVVSLHLGSVGGVPSMYGCGIRALSALRACSSWSRRACAYLAAFEDIFDTSGWEDWANRG
jgi:hypothetical protein